MITEKEVNERDITDVGDGFGYRFNTSATDRLMIDLFLIKDREQVNFNYKILPITKDNRILVANQLFNWAMDRIEQQDVPNYTSL